MAYRRTEWALERTQLAWVRTAFALISAGLALDQGAVALHEANLLRGRNWVERGHVVGVGLAVAAGIQLAAATALYLRRGRILATDHGQAITRVPLALPISIAVTLLGFIVAVLLVALA